MSGWTYSFENVEKSRKCTKAKRELCLLWDGSGRWGWRSWRRQTSWTRRRCLPRPRRMGSGRSGRITLTTFKICCCFFRAVHSKAQPQQGTGCPGHQKAVSPASQGEAADHCLHRQVCQAQGRSHTSCDSTMQWVKDWLHLKRRPFVIPLQALLTRVIKCKSFWSDYPMLIFTYWVKSYSCL